MAAKTKSIAHGVIDFFVLCCAQRKVKFIFPLRLHFICVNSWRDNIFLYGFCNGNSFYCPGCQK